MFTRSILIVILALATISILISLSYLNPENQTYKNKRIEVITGGSHIRKPVIISSPQQRDGMPEKKNFRQLGDGKGDGIVPDLTDRFLQEEELPPSGASSSSVLHKRFLTQSRDNIWADKAERNLTDTLRGVAHLDTSKVSGFRVLCKRDICEINGQTVREISFTNANQSMIALQNIPPSDLDRAGIRRISNYSFQDNGRGGFAYLIYARR